MSERIYTLSSLAKASRRSKATLVTMIESNELAAERDDEGRRSWRITHRAAVAAGLFSDPPAGARSRATVDAAVAAIVQQSVAPLAEAVADMLSAVNGLRDTFEQAPRWATMPVPPTSAPPDPVAEFDDAVAAATVPAPATAVRSGTEATPRPHRRVRPELVLGAASLLLSVITLAAVLLR